MTQHPGEAIIHDFLHRDEMLAKAAFGQITDLYSRRLYTTIRRWTRNHDDTSDILQEVLIKTWKHRGQFEGKSALFSWIYRIAWTETLQFIKKEKKHAGIALDDPMVAFSPSSEHYGKVDPESIVKWLQEALEKLPQKQRMVFEYRYFDDMKYEQIAALTGLSTGGLKANYFHAAQKVEEFLKTRLNHL